MLYTEDFCMRYYAGFSQIGSHMVLKLKQNFASAKPKMKYHAKTTLIAIRIDT